MTKLESKKKATKKNDLSIKKRKQKQKMQVKGSSAPKKVPNKQKTKPSPNTKKSKINKKVTLDSNNKIKKPKNNTVMKNKKKVLGKKSNVKKDPLSKQQPKTKRKLIKDSNRKMKLTKKKNKHQFKGSSKVKSKSEIEDESLMEKFNEDERRRKEAENQDSDEVSDPTQLIKLEMVHQAVSGIRKLAAVRNKSNKNLLDGVSDDDSFIFLQVTICKMPYVVQDQHLIKPITINMPLPNSLVNDETEVILITQDLERGIKPDHEPTLNFYQELLQKHNAASLVNEVIPLRQLKVEYKEFEAKRNLSSRVEVVLCDDTVIRFIPKFLGKHFYKKKKIPVQVNLKAKNLHSELKRALSVSQLSFTMQGNCALMKVGRLSHTDEEIAENILAVVKKLANRIPGKWKNVQNLSLKLETSKSVPFFIRIGSLNDIGEIAPKPYFKTDPVSGTLTTCPRKCVTVFPDGNVTVRSLNKNKDRIPEEERKTKKARKKLESKQKVEEETKMEVEREMEENKAKPETAEVESVKRTGEAGEKRKAKKQKLENAKETSDPGKESKEKKRKVSKKEESDSEEEELEAQELAYLKKRNEEQEAEKGSSAEEEDESESDGDSDPWDENSDYDILGSDDEELQ